MLRAKTWDRGYFFGWCLGDTLYRAEGHQQGGEHLHLAVLAQPPLERQVELLAGERPREQQDDQKGAGRLAAEQPGIGRLAVTSVLQRDFPVVQAVVMLTAVVFVFVNLLVDLIYMWLDPRIDLYESAST